LILRPMARRQEHFKAFFLGPSSSDFSSWSDAE